MSQPASEYRNDQTARLFSYHEQTKHSYASVRTGAHYLDWENQPDPFRLYEGADRVALPAPAPLEEPTFGVLADLIEDRAGHPPPAAVDLAAISRLLHHSVAISAWKKVRSTRFRYSLRVNPSSGNLHPTETYLALPDSLCHYRVPDHALERRRKGPATAALAEAAGIGWAAEAPLIAALSTIPWREAWKYRDRAYRYCLLDMGHAAAALLIAGRALGWTGRCVGHFPDLRLAELLGLDGVSEAPMILVVFGAPPGRPTGQAAGRAELGPLEGVPNALSAEEVSYRLIAEMHQSTRLPDPAGPCPSLPPSGEVSGDEGIALPASPPVDPPLGPVARKRRSALDFDPHFSIPIDRLGTLLAHATGDLRADFRGNLFRGAGVGLVSLYLYAHRIAGLPQGVYRYDPEGHRLHLRIPGAQERSAAYLSLEQELAGHAVAAFSMVADLERAAKAFGNRGYRYAHFEAGMIGQRLYLGAEALGFQSTGIGAFYDDEVHRHLGIEPKTGQVIYHFAIGRAVEDPRLVSIEEG